MPELVAKGGQGAVSHLPHCRSSPSQMFTELSAGGGVSMSLFQHAHLPASSAAPEEQRGRLLLLINSN